MNTVHIFVTENPNQFRMYFPANAWDFLLTSWTSKNCTRTTLRGVVLKLVRCLRDLPVSPVHGHPWLHQSWSFGEVTHHTWICEPPTFSTMPSFPLHGQHRPNRWNLPRGSTRNSTHTAQLLIFHHQIDATASITNSSKLSLTNT